MVSRPGTLLFFLVFAAVAAGGLFYGLRMHVQSEALRDQQSFLEQRVRLLEEENLRLAGLVDRLERAGVVDDPEAVIRRDIEGLAGELRGLEWERRIHYKIVTREGAGDLMRAKIRGRPLDAETNRRRLRAWERVGWIDEAPEWDRLVGRLLTGEASAFYDEEGGVLHVARGMPLEEAAERALLVHEMTLALLDQRFDLDSFYEGSGDVLWRNSDAELARRAVAVGDASLAALRYNAEYGSALVLADEKLGEFGVFAALTGKSVSAKVPLAVVKTATFPYTAGRAFCAALSPGGAHAALDAVYARPPSSTAEILDPEKYRGGAFRPRRYDWDEAAFRIPGREIIWSDVAGQWGCGLLLERFLEKAKAREAAAGWLGDRYIVYADEPESESQEAEEEEAVLWVSAWRDAAAATDFATAFGAALQARYALKEPVAGQYDGARFLSLEVRDDEAEVIFVDGESAVHREEMLKKVP